MPISLKSTLGGGGVPEGSLVPFPLHAAPDLDLDGVRYLRTGFIETDILKFDTNFYTLSRATTFTPTTFTPTASGNGIILSGQGNNVIVFYGSNARFYKFSTNEGVTWSVEQTFPCDVADAPIGCEYFSSGGLWVCATRAGRIYTSTNLTSWTQRYEHPLYVSNETLYRQIKTYSTTVVVVGMSSSGGALTTSSNGTTYTARTLSPNVGLRSVDFNGSLYVLGVSSNNNTLVHALTTTDFVSFTTKQIAPVTTPINNVVSFANNNWFSVLDNSVMYKSVNTDTWVLVDPSSTALEGTVTYQDGFYLIGTSSRSVDGTKWINNNLFVGTQNTVTNFKKIGNKYFVLGTTLSNTATLQLGNNFLFAGNPVLITNVSAGFYNSLVYYVKVKT